MLTKAALCGQKLQLRLEGITAPTGNEQLNKFSTYLIVFY